jgi:RNA-directed DNA polymerase
MVTGAASPDDPALTDYWAKRRRKVKPPLDSYTLRQRDDTAVRGLSC